MKKKIAVVGGGNSGEAPISLKSMENVLKILDSAKYDVYKVTIEGQNWQLWKNNHSYAIDKNDFSATIGHEKIRFDCVFNIIHGTPGEDGRLQGYWDLLGIPYTSCDLLVSALTFNKEVCKMLLRAMGVRTAQSVLLFKNENYAVTDIISITGLPCFVKPNNGGSSLGASKVMSENELEPAIQKAFKADGEVLIEEYLEGTEMTCGVTMVNSKPTALAITEIISENDFFDFDAKYKDQKTKEITPARLSAEIEKECKETSEFIYKRLRCKGMIRIDYKMHHGLLYMVEVNSIPGMTDRSLLPQQAQYYGLNVTDMLGEAIERAIAG